MALPTTARIKEFILINSPFMTKAEMAEELGSTSPTIGYHCVLMGITPITLRERACECIEKFKHLTQEQLAIKLEMTTQQIRDYAKDMGIEIISHKRLEMEAQKIKQHASLIPEHYPQEIKDYIYQATGAMIRSSTPIKRAPAVYTQSGSQLTDELKGIKTTTRVQVNASDAFFK